MIESYAVVQNEHCTVLCIGVQFPYHCRMFFMLQVGVPGSQGGCRNDEKCKCK